MQRHKIVFGGAMGAGKSQAISSLSEIKVLGSVDVSAVAAT